MHHQTTTKCNFPVAGSAAVGTKERVVDDVVSEAQFLYR
jgi:hypothetical protein